MSECILEAKEIAKSVGEPQPIQILKGLSIKVSRGESLAIMGRSGEGKTTLLHILGSLDTPCSGTVMIAGKDVARSDRNLVRQQHVGFIFQSFHLLQDYTALENVLMPARIARKSCLKHSEACERAEALLEAVGLSHRKNEMAKVLSGGEKQRVTIARALCNNPDLILADEPTGNLDQHTSDQIHELLISLCEKEGKTVVIVTHDPDLAGLCSRNAVLQDGALHCRSL